MSDISSTGQAAVAHHVVDRKVFDHDGVGLADQVRAGAVPEGWVFVILMVGWRSLMVGWRSRDESWWTSIGRCRPRPGAAGCPGAVGGVWVDSLMLVEATGRCNVHRKVLGDPCAETRRAIQEPTG